MKKLSGWKFIAHLKQSNYNSVIYIIFALKKRFKTFHDPLDYWNEPKIGTLSKNKK